MTIGVSFIDPQKFHQPPEQSETDTLTKLHTDGLNGWESNNNHSFIFHKFLLLRDEEGNEVAARFFLIAYTRKSLEDFEKNEIRAMPVKTKLLDYRKHVNNFFLKEGKCMGPFANVNQLHEMCLPPARYYHTLQVIPKLGHGEPFERKYFPMPALYSPELSLSPAITIIRKFYLKSDKNVEKTIQLMLLGLFQSNWFKFFYAGLHLLEDPEFDWNGNWYKQFCDTMENTFNTTNRPLTYRCRSCSKENIYSYYDNEELLQNTAQAILDFLSDLNKNSDYKLPAYIKRVIDLTKSIKGINEFRMQRLTVIAACAGVVLKNNVKYATFGFPSSTGGVSQKACERVDSELNELEEMNQDPSQHQLAPEYNSKFKKAKMNVEKRFHTVARLVCYFLGNHTYRYSWGEYLLCEAIGRKQFITDYLFYGQYLYYIFRGNDGRYVVKEKRGNIWCPLED